MLIIPSHPQTEMERLDLELHAHTLLLGGEHHLAPLKDPKKILDVGTGTGLWAIEMADRFPNATVIGVDLSPIQPEWVPDNLQFEIDDIESTWLWKPSTFDYIHSRLMISSISDWNQLCKNAFDHLKPGGWLELQELDPRVLSDDGTHEQAPNHSSFINHIIEACKQLGRPISKYSEHKAFLEEAGFVDIEEHFFKVPINTWPRDPQLKEVGKCILASYFAGYEGIGIGFFTRVLGWTADEFAVYLARIRAELKDRRLHTYHTL